ncbi:MAG: ACP phosphodiesterase [Xanthomonadales bacterium]|nr:ACP phosphodiesterase [Xanthomonadales bacterium]
MNFLAHLHLAGDDDGLRLGALLGDFTKGRRALRKYPPEVQTGIELHRFIDSTTDDQAAVVALRERIEQPFRRYAGIIIDLAMDHRLAISWDRFSDQSLAEFDAGVREMLARHDALVPRRLRSFMEYADRYGLFEAYRDEKEVLLSLRGVGRRFLRPNPLHRVDEIWAELKPAFIDCFEIVYPRVQSAVAGWLNTRSTTTGSWSEDRNQGSDGRPDQG